ncbi:MAG: hypothetical protein AAF593_01915 [Planctomycetota bacterium]
MKQPIKNKKFTLALGLGLIGVAGPAAADVRIDVFPDTQNFSERDVTVGGQPGPDIFNSMTTWLADPVNGGPTT